MRVIIKNCDNLTKDNLKFELFANSFGNQYFLPKSTI